MTDEQLCLVFIPALVAVLHHSEQAKGAPLTESEVLDIRDRAVCMTMSLSAALRMEEKRGYADIVAEDCWEQWQQARVELNASEPAAGSE